MLKAVKQDSVSQAQMRRTWAFLLVFCPLDSRCSLSISTHIVNAESTTSLFRSQPQPCGPHDRSNAIQDTGVRGHPTPSMRIGVIGGRPLGDIFWREIDDVPRHDGRIAPSDELHVFSMAVARV